MPLTHFHLGPGLFFGVLASRYLNLFAFLAGNVLLDIEPALVILYNFKYPYLSYPHHGILHSFLSGIFIALLIALVLKNYQGKSQKEFTTIARSKKEAFLSLLLPKSSFLKLFFSGLLGHWTHIIFDSFMHYDVFPFWPSHFNPLLNLISVSQNYFLCSVLGIAGLVLLFLKLKNIKILKHA
ncbi:DUF4184 family protein [Patescibacteria group bacterium]